MLEKPLLALLLCLGATTVASAANVAPIEFLDERSGATFTIVHSPLVFAYERSSLAADARDYVSLTAVEIDHTGKLALYLVVYLWSSIDWRSHFSAVAPAPTALALLADGRNIPLVPLAEFPDDLLAKDKNMASPPAPAVRVAYPATLELLRDIASSKHLNLVVAPDAAGAAKTYEIWDDGRKALSAFVERSAAFN